MAEQPFLTQLLNKGDDDEEYVGTRFDPSAAKRRSGHSKKKRKTLIIDTTRQMARSGEAGQCQHSQDTVATSPERRWSGRHEQIATLMVAMA